MLGRNPCCHQLVGWRFVFFCLKTMLCLLSFGNDVPLCLLHLRGFAEVWGQGNGISSPDYLLLFISTFRQIERFFVPECANSTLSRTSAAEPSRLIQHSPVFQASPLPPPCCLGGSLWVFRTPGQVST